MKAVRELILVRIGGLTLANSSISAMRSSMIFGCFCSKCSVNLGIL